LAQKINEKAVNYVYTNSVKGEKSCGEGRVIIKIVNEIRLWAKL